MTTISRLSNRIPMPKTLTLENLHRLIDTLLAEGVRVVGPKRTDSLIVYAPLAKGATSTSPGCRGARLKKPSSHRAKRSSPSKSATARPWSATPISPAPETVLIGRAARAMRRRRGSSTRFSPGITMTPSTWSGASAPPSSASLAPPPMTPVSAPRSVAPRCLAKGSDLFLVPAAGRQLRR